MSLESNIILISNNSDVEQVLKPKLVLLRDVDNILTVDYASAIEAIREGLPDMVLLHCADENQDCVNLIKKIRTDELIKDTCIVLVVDKYNQDFLLSAYDENITDYITVNADDAEVLMRTIWALKKDALMNKVKKQHNLLEKLGVIAKDTGFYSEKFCEKVFETEMNAIRGLKEDCILMLVSPSESSKVLLDMSALAGAIKKSTRNSDVIIHGSINRFYILLNETNLKGAFCVWEKIKQSVGDMSSIISGVSVVGEKSFEVLKSELLSALIEAEATKKDLVIVNEEIEKSTGGWLDKINSTQKNFKLFKQAFSKKLDKVITPVFYQMQKLYEEKLFETLIEQYSNATLSSFVLRKASNVSELKITYPGFSKINIDIVHQGLDSPENKRISLDLTEIDEYKLTQILESFIKEFKDSTDK